MHKRTANRSLMAGVVAGLLALSGAAGAQSSGAFQDVAKVTRVEPLFRTVQVATPVERCWNEPVTYRSASHGHGHGHGHRGGRSYTGPILGGVVGGLVGNQFGGGDGRTLLTVAGAVLGASIGNDISRQSHRRHHRRHHRASTYTVNERRCSTTQSYTERRERDGYLVEYRYRGQVYTTQLDYDPGRTLPVTVEVVPAR